MAALSYATTAELALWGLPAATLAEVPAEVQVAMLAAASRDVDRMASRYASTPFTAWGDDIKQAVCEIAAWKIMVWRGYDPEGDRDPLRDRAQAAMAWVLRSGEEGTLPGTTDQTPGTNEGTGVRVFTAPRRGW